MHDTGGAHHYAAGRQWHSARPAAMRTFHRQYAQISFRRANVRG